MGLFDFISDLFGIGDAPEPDPAIGEAAGRNAAIGERYVTLAENTYDDQKALFEEYSPILKNLLTTAEAEQGKSIKRADDAWASYNETWKPIEKEMAARTLELASPGRVDQEGQRAASEATSGYDRARTTTQRSLAAAGASPEKIAAIEASGRLMEAKGVAGVASGARRDTEARALGYLDNASRFGRGMTSTGLAAAGLATNQGGATQSAYGGLVNAANAPASSASSLYSGAVGANNASVGNYMSLFNAESQTYGQKLDFTGDIIGAGATAAGGA